MRTVMRQMVWTGERAESVHLQLEDEIVVIECGGPERGAGGAELRGRQF